mgnify:FL=1
MKNRIIALALCAGMLLLGGCASHDEAAGSPPESSVGDTPSSVETEAPPEESGEPISDPEDSAEAEEPEKIAGIIAMTSEISGDCTFSVVCIDPNTG